MVKEVKMYTVICDNCGADALENDDFSAWSEADHAEDIASNAGWMEENGKHYCPDCMSYDDDDNLILKPINLTP